MYAFTKMLTPSVRCMEKMERLHRTDQRHNINVNQHEKNEEVDWMYKMTRILRRFGPKKRPES